MQSNTIPVQTKGIWRQTTLTQQQTRNGRPNKHRTLNTSWWRYTKRYSCTAVVLFVQFYCLNPLAQGGEWCGSSVLLIRTSTGLRAVSLFPSPSVSPPSLPSPMCCRCPTDAVRTDIFVPFAPLAYNQLHWHTAKKVNFRTLHAIICHILNDYVRR